jgi:hypothetical protein
MISLDIRVWPPPETGLAPDETIDLGLRLTPEPAQDRLVMTIYLSP